MREIKRLAAALASQAKEIERLKGELRNIANAERFRREHFEDDTAFAKWRA